MIIPRPRGAMKETTGWNRFLRVPLTLNTALSAGDRQKVIPLSPVDNKEPLQPLTRDLNPSQACRYSNNNSSKCAFKRELSPEEIITVERASSFLVYNFRNSYQNYRALEKLLQHLTVIRDAREYKITATFAAVLGKFSPAFNGCPAGLSPRPSCKPSWEQISQISANDSLPIWPLKGRSAPSTQRKKSTSNSTNNSVLVFIYIFDNASPFSYQRQKWREQERLLFGRRASRKITKRYSNTPQNILMKSLSVCRMWYTSARRTISMTYCLCRRDLSTYC